MLTLNDKLNTTWVDELKNDDPDAFKPESFVLPGKSLRRELSCQRGSCSGPNLGKGEMILKDGKQQISSYYFVFCFTCNRVYHLNCAGHKYADFVKKELKVPFKCQGCIAVPQNETAKEFFTQGNWNLKVVERKNAFLIDAMKVEDLNESTDKIDEESIEAKYELQRLEFEKLADKFQEVVNERTQLEVELRQQKEDYAELSGKLKDYDEMKNQMQVMQSQLQALTDGIGSDVNHGATTSKAQPRTSIDMESVLNSTRIGDLPVHTVEDVLKRQYLNRKSDTRKDSSILPPRPVESTAPLRSQGGLFDFVAPLRHKRLSFADGINVNDLSQSEKIVLEQAQAQKEASEAQLKISKTLSLEVIRKGLHKISKFDGDPRKFIKFKQDINRYRNIGQYEDEALKLHIFQALEGIALLRVQDVFDAAPLTTIMKMLEDGFGNPERIIEKCGADILSLKLNKELYRDDVMLISTKIQAYFTACDYADAGYANSNQLARHIFDQMNLVHKQLFRHQFRSDNPGGTKLIDLESLYKFLEDLSKDLEDKKVEEKKAKAVMVMSVPASNDSSNSSSGTSNGIGKINDDTLYELRDSNMYSYHAYDLNLLERIPRVCDCCGMEGHYTVQCDKFKEMDANMKNKFIFDKGLCRNCIVTNTHRSFNCDLKNACGYSMNGNERCNRKHHLIMHKIASIDNRNNNYNRNNDNRNNGNYNRRRSHTNYNQQRATNIVNNAQQVPQQVSNSAPSSNTQEAPQVNQIVANTIAQAPSISQVPPHQLGDNRAWPSANGNTQRSAHTNINFTRYMGTQESGH